MKQPLTLVASHSIALEMDQTECKYCAKPFMLDSSSGEVVKFAHDGKRVHESDDGDLFCSIDCELLQRLDVTGELAAFCIQAPLTSTANTILAIRHRHQQALEDVREELSTLRAALERKHISDGKVS